MINKTLKYLSIMTLLYITNCTNAPRYSKSDLPRQNKDNKVSNKTIKNKSPKKHRKVIKGISSFYAEDFHGKLTANGEVYDMYGLTAAHKTMPLNTICRVTNLENDKSLILRINDRGPYIKGRILDCSYGAAKKLDFIKQGTTMVKIEVIEWGDDKYMKHRTLDQ